MEQDWILITVAAVVFAGLLSAYITRLTFRSKTVARRAFDDLQAELYAQKENLRAAETRHEQAIGLLQKAEAELNRQKDELDAKRREFIVLNNDHSRRRAEIENLGRNIEKAETELQEAKTAAEQLRLQWQQQVQQATHWKSQHEAITEKLASQQQTMDAFAAQMKKEFSLLADNVLSHKAQQFNQQQETKLNDLLTPLRQNLDSFKKEITDGLKDERGHRSGLQAEVKLMAELNKRLSEQANNLTKALSTNVKQQGDWGEVILETILQYVGLQKDVHYTVQQTTINADGQTIRPDCIVRYPDSRFVVIDSKVSLVHYKQLTEADGDDATAAQLMLRSMRQHIDGLAGKRYDTVSGVLDYVFMFIPVEGAFITAMQQDGQLWQYAFDKKILLVSPTLLVSGIKLIHELWRQDNVNRNAEAIALKAGALYDKFHGFVQSFDEIGKKLQQAQASFATADNQLRSGKGNVLKRANDIKLLGAKATKTLATTTDFDTEEEDADRDEP